MAGKFGVNSNNRITTLCIGQQLASLCCLDTPCQSSSLTYRSSLSDCILEVGALPA